MRPEIRSSAEAIARKEMMYKKAVSGFVAAIEMALEQPDMSEGERQKLLDGVFEKLDQEQRARFFDDVNKYAKEIKLTERWPAEKKGVARKLFQDYRTQKFIELEEQEPKAA